MNRIEVLFKKKSKRILSVYFTAGYPKLNDTVSIIQSLEAAGADLIEVGIPFSDPIADGPTIQQSNGIALDNGMTLKHLLNQLEGIREKVSTPLILMGYINPIVQYGMEAFCRRCAAIGVDGLILPDLPMFAYLEVYKSLFDKYGLHNIFLITPQTSSARIREIDEKSNGFIYMVSSSSTTGVKADISKAQEAYFARIKSMNLKNPTLIGFGISNKKTFDKAATNANGAIIGSAFIREIGRAADLDKQIKVFIKGINGQLIKNDNTI